MYYNTCTNNIVEKLCQIRESGIEFARSASSYINYSRRKFFLVLLIVILFRGTNIMISIYNYNHFYKTMEVIFKNTLKIKDSSVEFKLNAKLAFTMKMSRFLRVPFFFSLLLKIILVFQLFQ